MGFDYVDADALIHELSVANGRIVTKSGMRYRVLGLDPYSGHMSLPVLRAIDKLVEQGASVAGQKPFDDPSLADDHTEFDRLNRLLFGDGSSVHKAGKGTVFAGQTVQQTLAALDVQPDFSYTPHDSSDEIQFVHRRLPDADIYFLNNRSDHGQAVEASFRVTGKAPELWYAENGTSKPVSYRIENGRTILPLHLESWGTVFVVFRHRTQRMAFTLPEMTEKTVDTIAGPWMLEFMPDRGAPSSTTLETLSSWSDNPDPGIRYYSGTGTYHIAFDARQEWFTPGAHLWLDLGDVRNLAHVTLNGKDPGVVWHAPFRLEITGILKPGRNELTIQVINAWVNRLIGDQQPGATQYTYADIHPYKADSPLLPSGLLGPVTIISTSASRH
jgi:hypothetical protein